MKKSQIFTLLLFFFVYSDIGGRSRQGMKIFSYKPEFFKKKAQMTEEQAFKFLSKYPLARNVNYAAVPWTVFYAVKESLQKKLSKIKLSANKSSKKKSKKKSTKKKLESGFTVCQHIKYREIIPILKKLGITLLFAPHAPEKQEFKDVLVVPFPIYPTNGVNPAEEKDILYSFIGFRSHLVRREIFSFPDQSDVVIKRREKWHFHLRHKSRIMQLRFSQQREEEKKEYQDVLARSRFSLCPRGTGPSTIRFWESLQAGAIPVLIADDMTLPKVKGINWDDCIIRIAEKDVSSIDKTIRAISLEKEEQMRQACLRAFTLSCAGKNFIQTIRTYFEEES
jgi:Exostosin family